MTDGSSSEYDPQTVELRVPALSAYVSVLRTTAAALAARLDFTIDEIEDLRIGVDEASALLLHQAVSDSDLTCEFTLGKDRLRTAVSVRSHRPHVPAEESFAWTVLTALAGPIDAEVDADAERVTLTLTKRAEAVHLPTADARDMIADEAGSAPASIESRATEQ